MKAHDPIRHLRVLNARGKVALFVGAGVSLGCGLPDWETLLDRLMLAAFGDETERTIAATNHYSAISRAKLIRTKLSSTFCRSVADALYADSYHLSPTVDMIVKSGVRRVVCYNFDDVLDEAYATEGIQTHSLMQGQKFNNNFRGTTIFYPHGYLPRNATQEQLDASQIVLDETEYNHLYSDPYNWANLIQLSHLMNFTCLFVGCSLQDPNIRRLLDVYCRLGFSHQHYAVFRSPLYAAAEWDKPLAQQIKSTLLSDLDSLLVHPVWVNRYEDIPRMLKSIRNKKEKD